MSLLKIVTIPNKILSLKAKPIEKSDKKIEKLAREMIETVSKGSHPGVGLAAPQVNVLKQMFVIFLEGKDPLVFINPKLLELSKELTNNPPPENPNLEGCLSVPGIYGLVKRSKSVRVAWQDLSGKLNQKTFSDFEATVIQHEYDHLQGILFPQRVKEQGGKLFKLEIKDAKETLTEIKND